MVAVELNFTPKDDSRGEDFNQFDGQLEQFLGSLSANGNIFGDWIILELDDYVQVRATAPEGEAILKENWIIYAQKSLEELRPMCRLEPTFQIIAEEYYTNACCQCKNSSSYILITNFLNICLPVECGDCRAPVPLYRLPHIKNEEEHWTIRNWHKTYVALDTLYMKSYIGERFSYRHLTSAHSELTKWSLKIAKAFEEKTAKPFFVFLMHPNQRLGPKCPRCRRNWQLETPWHDFFVFKCDHCRLVSSEASEAQETLSEMHP